MLFSEDSIITDLYGYAIHHSYMFVCLSSVDSIVASLYGNTIFLVDCKMAIVYDYGMFSR